VFQEKKRGGEGGLDEKGYEKQEGVVTFPETQEGGGGNTVMGDPRNAVRIPDRDLVGKMATPERTKA